MRIDRIENGIEAIKIRKVEVEFVEGRADLLPIFDVLEEILVFVKKKFFDSKGKYKPLKKSIWHIPRLLKCGWFLGKIAVKIIRLF